MRIRSPKDFWAGLIFVAIAVAFIVLAQQYRLGDLHRMGPAMFPTLVGALLAALGLRISAFKFKHGEVHELASGLMLADSYHCSRYNTNTGVLTPKMFRDVFARVRKDLG